VAVAVAEAGWQCWIGGGTAVILSLNSSDLEHYWPNGSGSGWVAVAVNFLDMSFGYYYYYNNYYSKPAADFFSFDFFRRPLFFHLATFFFRLSRLFFSLLPELFFFFRLFFFFFFFSTRLCLFLNDKTPKSANPNYPNPNYAGSIYANVDLLIMRKLIC
jgi:hypothetical protein